MDYLLALVPTVAGAAILIRALVEAGKAIHIKGKPLIADGDAGKWQTALNAAFYLGINFLSGVIHLEDVDYYLAELTRIVPVILVLLVILAQMGAGIAATKLVHEIAKKVKGSKPTPPV